MKNGKTAFAESVSAWTSVLAQHRYETEDFKTELHTLTDAGLLNLKPVTRSFLDFAPRMFAVVKPQHFVELRLAIAYLADLYERQSVAMERELVRMRRQTAEQARLIKFVQNSPASNDEKIRFVKDFYGWE